MTVDRKPAQYQPSSSSVGQAQIQPRLSSDPLMLTQSEEKGRARPKSKFDAASFRQSLSRAIQHHHFRAAVIRRVAGISLSPVVSADRTFPALWAVNTTQQHDMGWSMILFPLVTHRSIFTISNTLILSEMRLEKARDELSSK
ncbi:hypothetical protein PG999_003844 [Apiospora kogelbergensis]|uniref:Uncharacterized protein n=1 Tax=Apiospora kogelbergensis TaxID=1337665 RepID=A0AAW0R4Y4_9PEZI